MPNITVNDFESLFGEKLSPYIEAKVHAANLQYDTLNRAERDTYLLSVFEELLAEGVSVAGVHRQPAWEKGWGENLKQLLESKDVGALVPKYHRKRQIVHWMQDVVKAKNTEFDLVIHEILVDYVLEKYLGSLPVVMEFGCGPAYHLLRLRKINRQARLVGLDWASASVEIIKNLKSMGVDLNIDGRVFDFFKPDAGLLIPPGTGIYTVAALEQVGERHEPFIQFLLEKKPAICVHLEPIGELLDPTNLVDRLSQLYFNKRHYLSGFLNRLRKLRDEGKVTIHREQRTFIGSYFIEGHSLIVWSPNV